MANRFALTEGDWNDTATWAATSGGASGVSVPGINDDVNLDGHEVTLNANATIKSLANGILYISGTRTLSVTDTIVANGQMIIFRDNGNLALTANMTVADDGGVFSDDGTVSGTLTLSHTGTITMNDHTGGLFGFDAFTTKTITLGTVTIADDESGSGNYAITTGGGTTSLTIGTLDAGMPAIQLGGSGTLNVTTMYSRNATVMTAGLINNQGDVDGWDVTIGSFHWDAGGMTPFLNYDAGYSITNFYFGSTLSTTDLPAEADVRSMTTFAGGTMVGELSAGGGGGGSLRMGL